MVTLENSAIVKSLHGGLYKNNISYCLYGSKGRMESARNDARNGEYERIYVNCDEKEGDYGEEKIETYLPNEQTTGESTGFGHGGSDFYAMYYFIEKILGDENADVIDIYEALDMSLPGLFAFRSILAGGKEMMIPNLRLKEERDKWRNDTACTDPKVAGDSLLPTSKEGTPDIPQEVYDKVREKWESFLSDRESEK